MIRKIPLAEVHSPLITTKDQKVKRLNKPEEYVNQKNLDHKIDDLNRVDWFFNTLQPELHERSNIKEEMLDKEYCMNSAQIELETETEKEMKKGETKDGDDKSIEPVSLSDSFAIMSDRFDNLSSIILFLAFYLSISIRVSALYSFPTIICIHTEQMACTWFTA